MKKIFLIAFLGIAILAQAQFFGESNKNYLQIGPVFAKDNMGLYFSYEEQVGTYISFGLNPIILLQKQTYTDDESVEHELKFGEKIDLRAKMSIHLSQVLKIEKFDIYPGLNLGLHNLGFHGGAQFYLAEGFTIFGEANVPLAKYKDNSRSSFDKTFFALGLGIDL